MQHLLWDKELPGKAAQARAQQEVLQILATAHPSVYGKLKELNGCEQVGSTGASYRTGVAAAERRLWVQALNVRAAPGEARVAAGAPAPKASPPRPF